MPIPRFAIWGIPKGNNLIKHLMCFLNVFTLASGAVLITAGCLALTDVGCSALPHDNLLPAISMITAGLFLIVFVIVGCCGAIKDSVPLLLSYAVVLGVIFILEVAVSLAIIICKDQIRDHVRVTMQKLQESYISGGRVKKCIDGMHQKMECCGIDSPLDWTITGSGVPESCCYEKKDSSIPPSPLCNPFQNEKQYLHEEGCYEKVTRQIDVDGNIIFYCAAVLSFFKISSTILACWLSHRLRKEYSM